MNIEFEKLKIQGFKSFVGEPSTIYLNDPGLHFVRGINKNQPRLGSNGAGKSSLWGALSWVLWGKTAEGLKNPDIAPWYSKQKTNVELQLKINDNVKTISRSISPNQLLLNGQPASPEAIEDLLQMDYSVFTNTILLGQSQPLFFDLQPRDKMQLFSDVLKLDRWEERSAAASKRVASLQSTRSGLQQDLAGLNRSLIELESIREATELKRTRWEQEQAEKAKDRTAELEKCKADLAPLQNKLDKADLAYDGAATEAQALQNEVQIATDTLVKAQANHTREQLKWERARDDLAEAKNDLAEFAKAKVCPTCGQSIKQADIKTHKSELNAKIVEFQKIVDAGIPDSVKEEREKASKLVDQARKNFNEFNAKANKALETVNFLKPQVLELQLKIKQIKEAAQEQRETINPFTEQLQTLRRRKTDLTAQKEKIEEDLHKTERRIERAQFWVRGFKDVRLYVIEETLAELELVTNSMLEDVGLVDWQVRYDIEKETKSGTTQRGLNVLILSPDNKEAVRWESWSGGEGQRLRLIGSLALREVLLNEAGISTNLEILDEPSRHLSKEGIIELVACLSDRAHDLNHSLFYCDHSVVESAEFDSVITVVKDKQGSYVV